MNRPETVTLDLEALEAIIAEAIMLTAWSGKLKPPGLLWAGRAVTPSALERAMRRVLELAGVGP